MQQLSSRLAPLPAASRCLLCLPYLLPFLLLQEKGRIFRESFISKLQLLLRGTVAAPPERFGETLADEHIRGGAFVGPDNKPVIVNEHLPNAHMRLFGGAQYHRAMAEFRAGAGARLVPWGWREGWREKDCCQLAVICCQLLWGPSQLPAHLLPAHLPPLTNTTLPACLPACLQASAPSPAPTSRARRLSTPAALTTSTTA